MKFILPALLAIAVSTPAFANLSPAGARTSVLECIGTLNELSGNFKDGMKETPRAVSIKLSGQDNMRYGARVLLDDDLTNNAASSEDQGAPRSFERLLYWSELLLGGGLP